MPRAHSSRHIPERFLRQIWKKQYFNPDHLQTTDGRTITVFSAGTVNTDGGPDFVNALIRVGDPMRNIAPCISCHGGVDQKLGAPWLEGMPKGYLVAQIEAFKSGARANDPQAQMRNMVRGITMKEIDDVATFYARKAGAAEAR